LADWVCLPLYFVSKLAKESGITVVQCGEGSDEIFFGYDSYVHYINFYSPLFCTSPKKYTQLAKNNQRERDIL